MVDGFDAAVAAIEGWAAGTYGSETKRRLLNVAEDLRRNKETILAIAAQQPDGFYWLTSERAAEPSIAQRVAGRWYLVDEKGPVEENEIRRRGWDIGKLINDK